MNEIDIPIKDILRNKRIELGLTMKEVAQKVGVSEGTISRWESGEIANMRRDKIWLLSKALDMDPSIIMGWKKDTREVRAIRIPVLGRIAAGIPINAITEIIDWEEVRPEDVAGGKYFALQIRGDSMEPRIRNGDVIICRQQEDAEDGALVVAMVNGDDACCKKLKKYPNGAIGLMSTNPAYEPMIFTVDEVGEVPVRIIGLVKELRAKF